MATGNSKEDLHQRSLYVSPIETHRVLNADVNIRGP